MITVIYLFFYFAGCTNCNTIKK